MAKAKKDGDYLHCYIKSDIMADLNAYVEETEYSKTVVVEKAIRMFLDNEKRKNADNGTDLMKLADGYENTCKAFNNALDE